jgi:putative ABC transport system permease protein
MSTIAKRLSKEYPDQDAQRGVVVRPVQEVAVERLRPLLQVLMAAVGLVLLTACANVANLLFARGAARTKEVALRAALGASRGRLLRQMLAETMVLWLAGGALGLLVGIAGLRALLATAPVEIPPGVAVGLNGNVLLFLLVVTALSGIFSGLAPALRSSRGDLGTNLKEGGRTTGESARTGRLRGWLLISQVAVSMVLLVASGLMIQTILRLAGVHPGFSPKNLLTLEYRLPQTRYPDSHQQWSFHQRVRERVSQLPGVKSVSVSIGIPFTGNYGTDPVVLLDRGAPPPGQEPVAETNLADAQFFETMGIPLIAGRAFLEGDQLETRRVAVISQTMAQKYWPGGNSIGKQIEYLDKKNPATIVGVVGDVKERGLDEAPSGQVYLAFAQDPDRFATLSVRTESDPMSFANAVRQAVWSVDKDQPMWKVQSMEGIMERSVGNQRYLAYLLSGYAGLALLLAAVGTYGVLSYSVNRRVREIGLRMALGAQAGDALRMVIGDGMKRVAAGIAFGFAGTLALTRLMAGLLYDVEPRDPVTLASVSVVLALAGLLACWIPARRATKVDPVAVLRCE